MGVPLPLTRPAPPLRTPTRASSPAPAQRRSAQADPRLLTRFTPCRSAQADPRLLVRLAPALLRNLTRASSPPLPRAVLRNLTRASSPVPAQR